MSIEKKLDYKIKVISYIEKINMLNSNIDVSEFLNSINAFINEIQYMNIKGIVYFKEYVYKYYETIKSNDVINTENIKIDLKKILVDIYRDIIFEFNINVYFIGEDEYGFIGSEFLNLNITKSKSMDYIYREIDKLKEKSYNILIVENDSLLKDVVIDNIFYKLYNYKNLINQVEDLSHKIYLHDYNYYFLKYELENAKSSECDTLIVGNSYPLVGIDKDKLNKKAFNLSMHTQDLYYSYKLAKECISTNKNIKRCVIGVGYYLTYHDLSMGLSDYSKDMVRNIYVPLLNDMHNAKSVEESTNLRINDYISDDIISSIFNLDNICNKITRDYYSKNRTYFNDFNKRIGMLGGNSISEFSEIEKEEFGKQRGESHNNLLKYSKTNVEFKYILEEFLEFLNDNNVEAIITVFPSTKYYSKYISDEYKNRFYEVINYLNGKIDFKLIDFNEYGDFDESDFIDMDHLGEYGCDKVTNYLNDIIY